MKTAQRWNVEKRKYEPCTIPDNASLYETDMNEIVACANCGKLNHFGNYFTSLEIHSSSGMGYSVCAGCHCEEMERQKKATWKGGEE